MPPEKNLMGKGYCGQVTLGCGNLVVTVTTSQVELVFPGKISNNRLGDRLGIPNYSSGELRRP